MMRNNASVLAQSVSLNLPSSATSFNCTQIGDSSSSINSLSLTLPQYCLGVGLSVRTATISTTEKNHSLLYQILLIFLSWKTNNDFSLVIQSSSSFWKNSLLNHLSHIPF